MPNMDTDSELSAVVAAKLRAIVGSEHICLGADELARYSRCTIPWQRRCAAVVFPASNEEVASIMRIATEHRLPVWPFSKGRNWGYGTTLAMEGGALVMILERMNRIIEVNVDLAYAVIEPGVTYEQLNAHLKQSGDELWVDCIDGSAHGSVIGNALERGVGETPYGDHFGNLCGLEVVLPDGERLQVGGAANGLHTWHTHKWGVGPYLEGLFSQSNLGIVTKAGIWLMPKPEAYNSYVFEIGDEHDLPAVLDAFRKLALQGVVNTKLHMINDFVSLTILTQRINEEASPGGRLSAAELDKLRHKYGVSPWACGGGIYGTRAQVRLQRALLRKALKGLGRLVFLSDRQLALFELLISWCRRSAVLRAIVKKLVGASLPLMESAPHVHRILQGIPTDFFVKHAYYRNRQMRPNEDVDPARDRCGLIWFAPILPFDKKHVLPFLDACRHRFAGGGFDFYVALLLMNPRSVICLMAIIFDKDDGEEVARAEQLYGQLLADMHAAHFQQYRAGLLSWDSIFRDAPELQRLNDRIKAAVDPANVLAPGRYGIGRRESL